MTKVSEIMAKSLVTANRRDPIKSVVLKMEKNHLRCIPIVDKSKLVGLVSHGDIVRKIILEGVSDFSQTISVMSVPSCTASPDDDVDNLIKIMKDQHLKRVPIVKDGKLVGLITQTDIVNYEASKA